MDHLQLDQYQDTRLRSVADDKSGKCEKMMEHFFYGKKLKENEEEEVGKTKRRKEILYFDANRKQTRIKENERREVWKRPRKKGFDCHDAYRKQTRITTIIIIIIIIIIKPTISSFIIQHL
jgi:hypothetical protein